MAGRFTLWTDFKVGKTETSKEISHMKGQLHALENSAGSAMASFKGFLGAQVVGQGLNLAAQGIQTVTQEFLEFDQSITEAGARWGPAFDRGTEGFNRISEAARATGATTEHTSAQAGSALNYLAMSGFEAAEAVGLLPAITDLATASNTDFARSSDIASDALGAFGLAGGTSEEKIAGFNTIMDQATKSVNTSNQTLGMWFEAIKEGGPAFTAAGQEMSTLNATLGVLANSGKKGAQSGYLLRNVMANLAAPTSRAQGHLKKMGVTVEDSEGNYRSFIDILADLETGLGKMGDVKRAKIIKEIFDKRGIAGINILLQEGSESLREYAKAIEDSAGASAKVAEQMRGSIQNRIKKVQSAAIELGFKFFDAFGPRIERAIENVSAWLDDTNGNSKEFIEGLTDMAGGLADVVEFLVENRDHIIALTKAWLIFKGGMLIGSGVIGGFSAVNTALGVMQGNTGLAVQGVGSLKTSLLGVKAIMGGVTVALSAGLAIGNALWESMQRNEKMAQRVANKSLSQEKRLTKGTLSGYSDKSLTRLAELNRSESNRDYGWFDLNSEEHETTKRASLAMLKRIESEQKRRRNINRSRRSANIEEKKFGNKAQLESLKAQQKESVSRTETVERKEVRHTLELKDDSKRATLTPSDPGVMP